jgi:pimeloyl-ACP methyl ester carboxylesterase
MRQHISGSRLEVIGRAGHYAALEQPEAFARLLRQFVDPLSK